MTAVVVPAAITVSSVTMTLGLIVMAELLVVLVAREVQRQRGLDADVPARWLVPPLLITFGVIVVARFALLTYGA